MRFLVTVLLWMLTTVALAVTVPTVWAQLHVVSEDGYASLTAQAAAEPALQSAMASELATQLTALAAENGYSLNPALARSVAETYTQNSGFPGQFAQANRIAHRWMFTGSAQREAGTGDRWLIDVAPMLRDISVQQTLGSLNLEVPQTMTIPITVPDSSPLRPGQLRDVSTWGPFVSVGAAVLTGVLAVLTLAVARARGKMLAALGVSALLVGAAGWAGSEVARGHLDAALASTDGEIREVADVMLGSAQESLHHWLNMTLAVGAALVVLGTLAAILGGLRRHP